MPAAPASMAVTDNPFAPRPSTMPMTTKPSGRSMFGKQADSRKANTPAYSFVASSDREQASKMFLSQAHVDVDNRGREGAAATYNTPTAIERQVEALKVSAPMYTFPGEQRMTWKPKETPGPGSYKPLSALGDQPLSPNKSPPRPRFGNSTRDQAQKVFLTSKHVREHQGTLGPPPGSYEPPGALGAQPSSMRRSLPSYTMPRTDRLTNKYEELSKTLPPVGAYESWHAIGKQPLSTFKTLPSYGFGSSGWDKEEHRFLTSGHTRMLRGTQSPAGFDHQQDTNITSFGKQALSSKNSLPSYGFGRAAKLVFKTKDTPGPGAYD